MWADTTSTRVLFTQGTSRLRDTCREEHTATPTAATTHTQIHSSQHAHSHTHIRGGHQLPGCKGVQALECVSTEVE